MKYILYIGRWSPFHNGHKYIIDSALKSGHNVCIAIRDTEISETDPYPAWVRKEMIVEVYKHYKDRVRVIIIPNIEMVAIGREVGYAIMEIPENIQKVSATSIRAGFSNDLPIEVQKVIKEYNREKPF